MVSHIHYNLNANEDFVISFTSKLIIYMVYWHSFTAFGFTLGMKSQSIAHSLRGSEHLYWIWAFKVKCTQYGIRAQAGFKNARAICIGIGRGGQQLSVGIQKIKINWRDRLGCQIADPYPDAPFPHDGVIAWLAGARPNGVSSSPSQPCIA